MIKSLESEPGYNAKTELVKEYLVNARAHDDAFPLYTFMRLLLIKDDQRIFHMKDKKLLQVVALALGERVDEMQEHFKETSGDASATISLYFAKSDSIAPKKRSTLTLAEVDAFLDSLVKLTKMDAQQAALAKVMKKTTVNDLKWICRLIRGDLRAKTGAKHALAALHKKAFSSFQLCQNLKLVVDKFGSVQKGAVEDEDEDEKDEEYVAAKPQKKKIKKMPSGLGLQVFQPIKPMLAKVTKSYDDSVKRCPKMRVELKYDGERIQIHYKDGEFKFFSRNLKPVLEWKIKDLKPFISKSTSATSIILDAEILLLSDKGQPLPFGSLNKHKAGEHAGATVCLYLFDILFLNGEMLLDKPFDERRKILEASVTVVERRILFSRLNSPSNKQELRALMHVVMRQGQEGLVIKDGDSAYQPGKRAWLKMKKDHLKGEEPADTLDLVAVGAWYGTGSKGGKLTTLLMAARDDSSNKMLTVCKCGNGMDDEAIDAAQPVWHGLFKECPAFEDVPSWLLVDRKYVPDVVARDPKVCPVYEILASEFTETNHHTSGFSLRFPRFVRLRDDKDFASSTSLGECRALVAISRVTLGEEEQPEHQGDEFLGGPPAPSTSSSALLVQSKINATPKQQQKRGRASTGRPLCKYDGREGGCSRENPTHFLEFAHPVRHSGHTRCKHGAECYRTQAAHWKDFQHPDEAPEEDEEPDKKVKH